MTTLKREKSFPVEVAKSIKEKLIDIAISFGYFFFYLALPTWFVATMLGKFVAAFGCLGILYFSLSAVVYLAVSMGLLLIVIEKLLKELKDPAFEFYPNASDDLYMEDVASIALEAMALIEKRLKEFGVDVEGYEDDLYVPMERTIEKYSTGEYRQHM